MEVKQSLLKRAFTAAKNSLTPLGFQGLQPISSSGSLVRFRFLEGFLDYFQGGQHTAARLMHSYTKSPLVYLVVSKISRTSSAIPRVAVDENDEPIENSQVLAVLNNPGDGLSRQEFYEEAGEPLLLSGNTFIRWIEGIGAGQAMEVLKPGRVDPQFNTIGDVVSYNYETDTGAKINIPAEDVLHIRTSNIAQNNHNKMVWGVSPLQAMWVVVNASDEKFGASASIFKNKGIAGILTNKSDVPMLPQERQRLQDEFDEEVGGHDKFNKIKISTSDLAYIQTSMSPTDLKLLEGIMADLRLIAAAYGMPSVLFNDMESSTYNNIIEAKKSAFTDAYLPLSHKLDTKLSKFISDKLGLTTQEFIKVDLTRIEELRNTTNAIMNSINSLEPRVAARVIEVMRVNDVLEMIGLEPLTEGGESQLATLGAASETETDENE